MRKLFASMVALCAVLLGTIGMAEPASAHYASQGEVADYKPVIFVYWGQTHNGVDVWYQGMACSYHLVVPPNSNQFSIDRSGPGGCNQVARFDGWMQPTHVTVFRGGSFGNFSMEIDFCGRNQTTTNSSLNALKASEEGGVNQAVMRHFYLDSTGLTKSYYRFYPHDQYGLPTATPYDLTNSTLNSRGQEYFGGGSYLVQEHGAWAYGDYGCSGLGGVADNIRYYSTWHGW